MQFFSTWNGEAKLLTTDKKQQKAPPALMPAILRNAAATYECYAS
jgi:hypothetical protein